MAIDMRSNGAANDRGEWAPFADDGHAQPGTDDAPTVAAARPLSPSDIIRSWRAMGQIVRVATGFASLDEACRGGLPIPWRMVIVGAPSAGKTALATVLAHRLEALGLCIGILGVDEDPDDQNARFVQMAGFTIAQCELRDPLILDEMAKQLSPLRIRFYDATHTIEEAQGDLAAWAQSEKRRAAFIVDTVQTARCAGCASAKSPREVVEANAAALRAGVALHKQLLIGLSEANRRSYGTDDAVDTQNDMAAGAESRALEFMAQTLVMLRTPKGHADVVHVRVPKNRKGARAGFEFFLRLDRDRHALTECADPNADPTEKRHVEEGKRVHNRRGVEADAAVLAAIVRVNPEIGEEKLRAAVRAQGNPWGVPRYSAAKELLRTGLRGERLIDRNAETGAKGCKFYLAPAPQTGGVE